MLIVEDEPYAAEAISDGLRLEAIAAGIAGDGDTALEHLRIDTYELEIMSRTLTRDLLVMGKGCTRRPEIDIYPFRHARTTELINTGVPIEVVRRRTGAPA